MLIELELRQVTPSVDPVNGDLIRFMPRARFFAELHGLIKPVRDQYVVYGGTGGHAGLEAGTSFIKTDLHTEEGRTAFLDLWWPPLSDTTCLITEGPKGSDHTLPYPVRTMLRSAFVITRLAPDLVIIPIRFGAANVTTTMGRALWDIGIRRVLMHLTESFYQWLVKEGQDKRLTPLSPSDPNRNWEYIPGYGPREMKRSFYAEFPSRPITDDVYEWRKGNP